MKVLFKSTKALVLFEREVDLYKSTVISATKSNIILKTEEGDTATFGFEPGETLPKAGSAITFKEDGVVVDVELQAKRQATTKDKSSPSKAQAHQGKCLSL